MPYRRRRFSRRRGRKYRTNPFRRLRRRTIRRRPAYKRAILSNRRSIRNLQRNQEVKFISKYTFPNSGGDVPAVCPTPLTDAEYYAHGFSGISSGPELLTIDKNGAFTLPPGGTGGVFNPGLVVTQIGLAGQDGPDQNPGVLWAQGTRVGRWITMKSLCVKYQVSINERYTFTADPIQLVLMLVLDKSPGLKFEGDGTSDINFQWSDMKVNYNEAVDDNKVQQPEMLEFKTLDPAIRKRFHVLQRHVCTVGKNEGALAPVVMTAGLPTADGSTGVLAVRDLPAGSVAPFLPIERSGPRNKAASYVNYGTFFLKRRFRFDFGPITRTSSVKPNLPINQQIRLLAYVRTRQLQGSNAEPIQSDVRVDLCYQGKMRFIDS